MYHYQGCQGAKRSFSRPAFPSPAPVRSAFRALRPLSPLRPSDICPALAYFVDDWISEIPQVPLIVTKLVNVHQVRRVCWTKRQNIVFIKWRQTIKISKSAPPPTPAIISSSTIDTDTIKLRKPVIEGIAMSDSTVQFIVGFVCKWPQNQCSSHIIPLF